MNKVLLLTSCQWMFGAACLWAQTSSVENPIPLQLGEVTVEGSSAYFSYTADEDQLFSVTRDNSTYFNFSVDGTYQTQLNTVTTDDKVYCAMPKDQYAIINVNNYGATSFTFTASKESLDLTLGTSADKPVVVSDMSKGYYLPSTYDQTTYTSTPAYVSYTATESGTLVVALSSYSSGAVVTEGSNYNNIAFNYKNGGYKGNLQVEAGKTYLMEVKLGSPVIANFEIQHLQEGASCDMPFVAAESNVLPAAAGTYWYRYTAAADGFITLSSEVSLPSGQVDIYNTCESYSASTSCYGMFDLRSEVHQGVSLLIRVTKVAATDADQTFNIAYSEPQPGDSYANPLAIDGNGIVHAYSNLPMFFKVTVPEAGAAQETALIANGGFEAWETVDGVEVPTAWTSVASTSGAVSKSQVAHSGSYSAQVKASSSNVRMATQAYKLAAGTYTFSAFVKSAGEGDSKCKLAYGYYKEGATSLTYVYLNVPNYYTVPAAEWIQASESFTLAAETELYLVVVNAKGGENLLVDDVTLTPASAQAAPARQAESAVRFLNVAATTVCSSYNTNVAVLESQYNTLASGQGSARAAVNVGQEYIIRWTNAEGQPLDFTVSYEEVAEGDLCSNPLTAVLGENALAASTVKYYTYTAAADGWLKVTPSEATVEVSFPMDCSQYASKYNVTKEGLTSKIECKAGNTYLIVMKNAAIDCTFTIVEEGFAEGETCDMAIASALGTVALPEQVLNSWYKFVADKSGVMEISSTMAYEYASDWSSTSTVAYKVGSCEASENYMYDYNTNAFTTSFGVMEGQEVYVYLKSITAQAGKTLTVTVRDSKPGESCGNPIMMAVPTGIMGEASRNASVWYALDLQEGSFLFQATGYVSLAMYEECGASSIAESRYMGYDETAGCSYYGMDYTVTEEGTYLFEQTGGYGEINYTVSGTAVKGATGLTDMLEKAASVRVFDNMIQVQAPTGATSHVVITDMSGHSKSMTVAGKAQVAVASGAYVVTINGKAIKVLVK